MTGRRKIILTVLYALAAGVLFLFLLFPDAAVKTALVRGVENINPAARLTVGDVAPVFPPGLKLKDVTVSYRDKVVAGPDYIRLTPAWFSLLGESPRLVFKTGVFAGVIDGQGRFTEDRLAGADVRISGVRLESIQYVNHLSPHRLSGAVNGDLRLTSKRGEIQGTSQLRLSGTTVTLAAPVLDMAVVQFDDIQADLVLSSRRVEIKSCVFDGQDLDGEFSGNILLRNPFQNSLLNLKGSIKPQAGLIKRAGNTLPIEFLMKSEPGDKGFPVRLTGTFQEPRIAFR